MQTYSPPRSLSGRIRENRKHRKEATNGASMRLLRVTAVHRHPAGRGAVLGGILESSSCAT